MLMPYTCINMRTKVRFDSLNSHPTHVRNAKIKNMSCIMYNFVGGPLIYFQILQVCGK